MTTFIIALAICIVVGISSTLNKKKEALTYRRTNRGSRAVELEEWNKWSEVLLKEYNEITGLTIPYPKIKLYSDNYIRAYYIAFSDPYELIKTNVWKDVQALETLRIRHNLPSDDEIYILEEWMYNKKIICRPQLYTSLAYVIEKCVQRSVINRGYKYGGIDWDGQEGVRLKWKEIESKYDWLKNDPTDNDSS